MTLYQIALHPFKLQVSGFNTEVVESQLNAVLSYFQTQQPLPASAAHEPQVMDTPPCEIRFTNHHPLAQVEVVVKSPDADLSEVIDYAEPEIVNHAVRASTGLLWLHGACLIRDDECILLIAKTGTGKTTLSLGLLAQGYQLITDDIILIDLHRRQIIPMPRCPKIRPPAPDYLRAIGFDLNRDARLDGRYVLLPPGRFFTQPIPASINRVYLLHRDARVAPRADMLDLTSGILSLLHSSNLLRIDPALALAHDLFAQTTFIDVHLGDFASDLRRIANNQPYI